jgi:hypothetical protein
MSKSDNLVCQIGYRLHSTEKVSPLYRDSLFTCYFLWVWNNILRAIPTDWSYNLSETYSAHFTSSSMNIIFTLVKTCLPILYLHFQFFRYFGIFVNFFTRTRIFQFNLTSKFYSILSCSFVWINVNKLHTTRRWFMFILRAVILHVFG